MNKLVLIIATLSAAVLLTPSAMADTTGCQPTYGTGNCANAAITIDKKVADPSTVQPGGMVTSFTFRDNISVNDANKYVPGQYVPFSLTVKNTSNTTLTNIQVTDTFPNYISYVSSSDTATTNGNTVTVTIPSLTSGQSRTIYMTGQIAAANQLPSNQDTTCVINQAKVVAGSATDQDSAQVCVRNQATGGTVVTPTGTPTSGNIVYPTPVVPNAPSTGPEALALIGLLPTGIGGYLLRRKTK